ncbi:MAG: M48 family metalloprotease [bacterium]|nr:M48 family metalloprotease [bacterium]
MISALQKISQDSRIESIKKQTVATMCIETPFEKDKKTHKVKWFHNLLATHPSIEDRIEALKNYGS